MTKPLNTMLATTLLWCTISAAAYAQPARAYQSKLTFAASGAVWDRVPTSSQGTRNAGLAGDVSVEWRVSARRDDAWHVRVHFGEGTGNRLGNATFNYTRWLATVSRPIVGAGDRFATVYLAGGGGEYAAESFLGQRRRQVAIVGAIGLDAALPRTPLSIGAEYQVHTIGTRVFTTMSLGVRLHVW